MVTTIGENNPEINTSDSLGPIGLEIRNDLETYYLELKDKAERRGILLQAIEKNSMDFATVVFLTHIPMTTSVTVGYTYTGLAEKLGSDICTHYNYKVKAEHRVIIGAFVIDSYVRLGLVRPKLVEFKTNSKRTTVWMLYAKNRSKLENLRKEFPKIDNSHYTLSKQAEDWDNGFSKDERGNTIQLVRGVDYNTASKISKVTTPVVVNAINKKQSVAYKICSDTFNVFEWAFNSKAKVFDFFHSIYMNADARKSKLSQADMLLKLSRDVLNGKDNKFFQRYFCDFRGRIYPESKYLNEIGTDLAKGMLKLSNGKALGENGLSYLYHHVANCYGEDKISHNNKVKFVEENLMMFYDFGIDPQTNTDWMKADAPFQLLNACMEIVKLEEWATAGNAIEDFVSHTICYFDGSNNGAQWLFALAKDSKNSHLVNVIKSPDGKFGDFYKYVGNSVFNKIKEMPVTDEMTTNYNKYLKVLFVIRGKLRTLRDEMFNTKSSKAQFKLKEERLLWLLSKYQKRYKKELKTTNVLYWKTAIDKGIMTPNEFRTLVKRPCMTFSYSGTVRGFAQQILDDSSDFDNEYLQNKQYSACFMLAEMIYETIKTDFPELVAIRDYLTNVAGKYVDKNGKNLEFRTILSAFPFTNGYFKPKMSRITFDFYTLDKNDVPLHGSHKLSFETDTLVVDKRKGKLGISPNFVHQLDALHLQLVVNQCSFDIVSAHDSYGCLPSDAVELNTVIREQMVRVLENDPIGKLSEITDQLVELPKTGDLDVKQILQSDFAFA